MTYHMQRKSSAIQNDWSLHPELWRPVTWQQTHGRWEADVEGHAWIVELAGTDAEPYYRLAIDGVEVLSFEHWPWIWCRLEPSGSGIPGILDASSIAHLNAWGTALEMAP